MKPNKPKKEIKDYFLTLSVEAQRIRAIVAEITGNKITIAGTGESRLSQDVKEIESADIAISEAEKKLPQNILVEKTIFVIPVRFLEKEDQIQPEFLERLKKISKDLELKPQGFIAYPSLISLYLEKQNEAPPTALLLEISRSHLTFSLIRVGKIQQNITIERSDSLTADFETTINRFQTEILPSHIILYDESEKLEELREELLRLPWHKLSVFLHTPKIEILPQTKIDLALVEAVGSSLIRKFQPESIEEFKQDMQKEKVGTAPQPENDGIQITDQSDILKEQNENLQKENLEITEDNFGFVRGKDWSTLDSFSRKKKDTVSEIPEFVAEEDTNKESFVSFISNKLSLFHFPEIRFSLPLFPELLSNLFPIITTLVISLTAFLSLIWFYPKATAQLIVYPQIISEQLDIVLTNDPNKTAQGKKTVITKTIEVEVNGEKTANTTGKLKVGDKAKGEVTIYNKTLNGKSFSKGTVILNGDLKFSLDNDIKVASASDTGEGLSFGKVNTPFTANFIGSEGNLASGSIFIFHDLPENSFSAKNAQSFTGGTSREVTSVAKTDQTKLETDLTEELTSQAKQQLIQKTSSGEKLIEVSVQTSTTNKKFSNEIDHEAKEVSLKLTLKVNGLTFQESDLSNLASKSLTTVPAGYTLDNNKTGVKIEETKVDKSGNIMAKAIITAYFLPEIDTEKIITKLLGKTYSQAAAILREDSKLGGVKIVAENSLPLWKNYLPFRRPNLSLQVVSY